MNKSSSKKSIDLPFTFYLKRGVYYVRFRNESTGKIISKGISTGTKDKNEAVKIAYRWFASGEIEKDKEKKETTAPKKSKSKVKEKKENLETLSLKSLIHKADISDDVLNYVLDELKRRGEVTAIIKSTDKSSIKASEYLLNFWTWEKSEYIKEKLRQGQRIGKSHCRQQLTNVQKFWIPILQNKCLGEVQKDDIKKVIDVLADTTHCHTYKNDIIRSGVTAFRYAYNNEMLQKDITQGIIYFSGQRAERKILTPEIVQAMFSIEWHDNRAKLANLVAMLTGMRIGEILGLRLCDLGESCLYVNHSWNEAERILKCPKNGESRIVQLPFPQIISALKALGESNPYNEGMESFIFWATIPKTPIDGKIFLIGMRWALEQVGFSELEAKQYVFHAWRHYFSAYMAGTITDYKALQMQTGHKTRAMLEHYANHRIMTDGEKVRQAQKEVFGEIVQSTPCIEFDNATLLRNTKIFDGLDKSQYFEHTRQIR